MHERSSQEHIRHRRRTVHLADPELPRIFTRHEARASGLTDRQIERRLESGRWIPVRRGVYVLEHRLHELGDIAPGPGPLIAALITHDQRDLAISHASAAQVYELARPMGGWGVPTATTATGSTRLRDDVHLLVAPLAEGDVIMRGGLPVTTLARTVADCIRTLGPHDALAIADSAARQGLSLAELETVVRQQKGWPGIVQAREVLRLMDPARENAFESWTAWSFDRWELPAPLWQMDIVDETGFFCGRSDCWWPIGVVGEADGRTKYAMAAAQRGGADADGLTKVLEREREREMRMRRTGAEVVRWGPKDILRPPFTEKLIQELLRTFRRRERHGIEFRGTARPHYR